MDENYNIYVVEGPALDALHELNQHHDKLRRELKEFIKEIGAEDLHLTNGSFLVGVTFTKPPDASVWRPHPRERGYWIPRRKGKNQRALFERFHSYKILSAEDVSERFFVEAECAIVGTRFYSGAAIEWLADVAVVAIRKEQNAKPIEGLRQIKLSEYWAMKEANEAK